MACRKIWKIMICFPCWQKRWHMDCSHMLQQVSLFVWIGGWFLINFYTTTISNCLTDLVKVMSSALAKKSVEFSAWLDMALEHLLLICFMRMTWLNLFCTITVIVHDAISLQNFSTTFVNILMWKSVMTFIVLSIVDCTKICFQEENSHWWWFFIDHLGWISLTNVSLPPPSELAPWENFRVLHGLDVNAWTDEKNPLCLLLAHFVSSICGTRNGDSLLDWKLFAQRFIASQHAHTACSTHGVCDKNLLPVEKDAKFTREETQMQLLASKTFWVWWKKTLTSQVLFVHLSFLTLALMPCMMTLKIFQHAQNEERFWIQQTIMEEERCSHTVCLKSRPKLNFKNQETTECEHVGSCSSTWNDSFLEERDGTPIGMNQSLLAEPHNPSSFELHHAGFAASLPRCLQGIDSVQGRLSNNNNNNNKGFPSSHTIIGKRCDAAHSYHVVPFGIVHYYS